jgi:hypothetical protein
VDIKTPKTSFGTGQMSDKPTDFKDVSIGICIKNGAAAGVRDFILLPKSPLNPTI